MRRLLEELDMHVVVLLLVLAPLACTGARVWIVFGLAWSVLPQGRILVRAFVDNPSLGESPWPYFLSNEGMVLAVIGVSAGIGLALR
jgi:hypothetical protein